jgi:predicted deacylase
VFEFSRHFGGITVLHGVAGNGTLRGAAENIGIPAITLEAGGPNQLDKASVDAGVNALETMLQNLDIQPTLRFWGTPAPVFYKSHWLRADQGGILISSVELGDKVKKGDELGRVTDPVTNTGSTIIARESGRIIGMAVNQVVQTGFAVYHVGVAKEPKEVKEEALGIGDDEEQNAGLNDNDAEEQFEQE